MYFLVHHIHSPSKRITTICSKYRHFSTPEQSKTNLPGRQVSISYIFTQTYGRKYRVNEYTTKLRDSTLFNPLLPHSIMEADNRTVVHPFSFLKVILFCLNFYTTLKLKRNDFEIRSSLLLQLPVLPERRYKPCTQSTYRNCSTSVAMILHAKILKHFLCFS